MKTKKQRSKKIIIGIICIVLLIAIIIGIVLLVYKLNQLKKLDKMNSSDIINTITQDDNTTKISVAVINDGIISYHVYGEDSMILDNTKFDYEIGSISKTFVGLMLSKAISENKINISASISEYLTLDKNKYYPTIERLITHTSGYKGYYFNKQMISNYFCRGNDFYGINKNEILNKVKKITLKDKDYKFKYSNFGISIIGLVLEQVYNKDFVTLMNEFINKELNLKNTKVAECNGNLSGYWDWKQDDGYIPAGAIISNIEDMAQYLKYYMEESSPYVTSTYAAIKPINANNFLYEKMNIKMDKIGMAWLIDEKNTIIWHNGGTSNFNSYIAFNKDKNIGVVVLGNLSPTKKIPMTVIGAKLMHELINKAK